MSLGYHLRTEQDPALTVSDAGQPVFQLCLGGYGIAIYSLRSYIRIAQFQKFLGLFGTEPRFNQGALSAMRAYLRDRFSVLANVAFEQIAYAMNGKRVVAGRAGKYVTAIVTEQMM